MTSSGTGTATVSDGDLGDVIVESLDLGNPVDRQHASAAARRLTGALLLVAAVGCAVTVSAPGLLRGPAVMNGSARGTAFVMLLAGLPCIAVGMMLATRGSARGRVIWSGGLAYVLYNAVMLCFGTPFNELFLVYVAMLGLAFWSLMATLASTPFDDRWRPDRMKPVAAYLILVVALNVLAWLAQIVPALSDGTPDFLVGTGMTTNPIYVQDLAVWLPFMAAAGLALWTRHPWGLLLGGTGLVYWQLEALGVAVDQLFGHAADPSTDVATTAGAALFAALFAVGAVPTWSVLKALPRR